MIRVRWWVGDRDVRPMVEELFADVLTGALNVLVVFWLGQLAFPALGLIPPTLLGAAGLTGLALVLRRPIRLGEWMRRG